MHKYHVLINQTVYFIVIYLRFAFPCMTARWRDAMTFVNYKMYVIVIFIVERCGVKASAY